MLGSVIPQLKKKKLKLKYQFTPEKQSYKLNWNQIYQPWGGDFNTVSLFLFLEVNYRYYYYKI